MVSPVGKGGILMLEVISNSNSPKYYKELSSMHRLRNLVFKERMGWDLKTINGMEFDQYDTDDAFYFVHKDSKGEVNACFRLLPTQKSYMLEEVFPHLIEEGNPPKSNDVWEITRFAANADTAPSNVMGILVAGIIEFCLFYGVRECVSVTEVTMEPLLRRCGWGPTRLGAPTCVGADSEIPAAAQKHDISMELLSSVKRKARIVGNVITNLHELNEINGEKKVA